MLHPTDLQTTYTQFTYQLMGQALSQVDKNPYLGVMLQQDLCWLAHNNNICGKANNTLAFLRRNLKYYLRQLKSTAYTTLTRAGLEYSVAVWDPYKKETDKLEKVLRRAARFVAGNYERHSSVSAMLSELGWESLEKKKAHNGAVHEGGEG